MRVGTDMHALIGGEFDGAGVIEKAPRADHPLLAGRQGPADPHAAAQFGRPGGNSN